MGLPDPAVERMEAMAELDPGGGGPALDMSREALLSRTLDRGAAECNTRDQEDREWIEQALFGDAGAFGRLVERYFRLVHAIAFARLGSRETAEDLTQEVFLRVFLHLHDYDCSRPFSPWLARIARNLSINWAKAGQRYSSLVTMIPHDTLERLPQAERESERERMERHEQEELVRRLVFGLPEEMREAIMLHYMEGLSKKEIAQRLGVHPSTAGRLIERSIKALRAGMEEALHKAAPAVKPRRGSLERTLALIGAVAALSGEAKTLITTSAGGLYQLSTQTTGGASVANWGFVLTSMAGLAHKFWIWLLGLAVLAGGVQVSRHGAEWGWLKRVREAVSTGPVETVTQAEARQVLEVAAAFEAMQSAAAAHDYDTLIMFYDLDTWGTMVGLDPSAMRTHVLKGQPVLAEIIAEAPAGRIWIDGTEEIELEVNYRDGREPQPLRVPGPRIAVQAGDWYGRFVWRDGRWLLLNQQISGKTARRPGLIIDAIVTRRLD